MSPTSGSAPLSPQSAQTDPRQPAQSSPTAQLPLCVDLDGTLSRVDTLHELALQACHSWSGAWGVARSLLRGRAALKAHLAATVPFSGEDLPYHRELLSWLIEERAKGRSLALVTAANSRVAQAVSDHLGIFDEVIASDDSVNLKGKTKAERLVGRFGDRGFCYAGNDSPDVAVWSRAGAAIPVAASRSTREAAGRVAPIERSFGREGRTPLRAAWKAIRPGQWLKNVLVFVPIVSARAVTDLPGFVASLVTFLGFCALASSAYLINDTWDLASDRVHPTKRKRPIAAGELPVAWALPLALLLAPIGILATTAVGAGIPGVMYLIGTLTYSGILKTLPLVDVFTLGGLYTLRVIAGGEASKHEVSAWLMAFSGFVFVSLAAMKRVAELQARQVDGAITKRRPYQQVDARFLEILGMSSSVTASLVLALYVQSSITTTFTAPGPKPLWLLPPLVLFWQMRIWLSTFRGYMLEDPIAYAAKDWVTRLVAVGVIALFLVSGW